MRDNNEDAVFVSPRLVAIADGVGGAVGGEVASRIAADGMASLDKSRINGDLATALHEAVAGANATLGFVTECRPELAGMGTTLTAVALSSDATYLIANVGDSRAYLYRGQRLAQLTRDHSLVQMLIDQGRLTDEQARYHPQRSVVLEALDGVERALPPIVRRNAHNGDRLLLCSDGLSDFVADTEIALALAQSSCEKAVADLVQLAAKTSRDNISVIVADIVISDVATW